MSLELIRWLANQLRFSLLEEDSSGMVSANVHALERLGTTQPSALLQDAQNIQTIALTPWLMIPALPVILVILALNFMGDGLRDAADPYST